MWRDTHFSVINYSMYSSSFGHLQATVETAIRQQPSLRVVARVEDADAFDIAVLTPTNEPIAVRCVEAACADHINALRKMIAEGPFLRALLISRDASASISGVLCCHVDDIDQALAHLVSDAS